MSIQVVYSDEVQKEAPKYNQKKASGSSYTPSKLAIFVANKIVNKLKIAKNKRVRVLDPAAGDGELLLAIGMVLRNSGYQTIELYGFDINSKALQIARERLCEIDSSLSKVKLVNDDFLNHVIETFPARTSQKELFDTDINEYFDIVIANPPYVRTQVLGSEKSKQLAKQFGLNGRVDLYHAFIPAIRDVLNEDGILGIIVSNRFMTTKTGASVRECFLSNYNMLQIWDLGDTKLFDEAVLPAVIIAEHSNGRRAKNDPTFISCYSKTLESEKTETYDSILDALDASEINSAHVGGVNYRIVRGVLDHGHEESGTWRVGTAESDHWLSTIKDNTYCYFKDIGKIRVGVKTTADKVFIQNDWKSLQTPSPEKELLLPLITHKQARRWCPKSSDTMPRILYTHTVIENKRKAIDLEAYPKAKAYLSSHRKQLESRVYVTKSGREWFEIWVPHDPQSWKYPKLVFRDIAEENTFFIDDEGSVVNGDCYWMIANDHKNDDLIWLALAVGNSSFIIEYYDEKFVNKLYSQRRRFMTQYVNQFPIPKPDTETAKRIIGLTKKIYQLTKNNSINKVEQISEEIDNLIWLAFGLVKE